MMWLCTEVGVAHSGIEFAGFAVMAGVAEIVQRVGVADSRW